MHRFQIIVYHMLKREPIFVCLEQTGLSWRVGKNVESVLCCFQPQAPQCCRSNQSLGAVATSLSIVHMLPTGFQLSGGAHVCYAEDPYFNPKQHLQVGLGKTHHKPWRVTELDYYHLLLLNFAGLHVVSFEKITLNSHSVENMTSNLAAILTSS